MVSRENKSDIKIHTSENKNDIKDNITTIPSTSTPSTNFTSTSPWSNNNRRSNSRSSFISNSTNDSLSEDLRQVCISHEDEDYNEETEYEY